MARQFHRGVTIAELEDPGIKHKHKSRSSAKRIDLHSGRQRPFFPRCETDNHNKAIRLRASVYYAPHGWRAPHKCSLKHKGNNTEHLEEQKNKINIKKKKNMGKNSEYLRRWISFLILTSDMKKEGESTAL